MTYQFCKTFLSQKLSHWMLNYYFMFFCIAQLQQLSVHQGWYINSVVHCVPKHVKQMKMKNVVEDVLKDASVLVEWFYQTIIALILLNVKVII